MNASPANQIKLTVKIIPNASRNEVLGLLNGVWRIKIASPPEKGKANKELVAFLSNNLAIRKNDIQILKGHTSHNKLIGILGLAQEEISSRLLLHKGQQ